MGEKKKIYASMVDGATAGHSDKDLFDLHHRSPSGRVGKKDS